MNYEKKFIIELLILHHSFSFLSPLIYLFFIIRILKIVSFDIFPVLKINDIAIIIMMMIVYDNWTSTFQRIKEDSDYIDNYIYNTKLFV